MSENSWVTLATSDTTAVCCLVVAHSLREVRTHHKISLLITPGVGPHIRPQLESVFDLMKEVDDSTLKEDNPSLVHNPALLHALVKVHCWKLGFQKCVFISEHALVTQNCDELFYQDELSAAPDAGWPDYFETGVFVFEPSMETFNQISDLALREDITDEYVLLNEYFCDWRTKDIAKHLSFCYNLTFTSIHTCPPAYHRMAQHAKIVNFLDAANPMICSLSGTKVGKVSQTHPIQKYIDLWWKLLKNKIHHFLSAEMEGAAGCLAKLTLNDRNVNDRERYEAWEAGRMDYKGLDSFDNILAKLDGSINSDGK